ncbi:MAG: metallophosphoesterase [Vicinamibacterales bacterium]
MTRSSRRLLFTVAVALLFACSTWGSAGSSGQVSREKPRAQAKGAQTILFEPSSVNAYVAPDTIWLANRSLVATWGLARGGIRLSSISDRIGGRPAPRTSEAFALQLADGKVVRGSELRLLGTPRREDLPAASKAVVAEFESADGRLRVSWRASLAEGVDYVRQELTVSPARDALHMQAAILVDVEAREPKLAASPAGPAPPGTPAVGGGAFFFVEHADSRCSAAEERVRCELAPSAAITTTHPFRAAWVIGLGRPGDLGTAMRAYAGREGDKVPRSFIDSLGAFPSQALAAVPAQATPPPRPLTVLAGPYLQRPGQTEMTVMWITDQPSAGWVEYGPDAAESTAAPSMPASPIRAFAVRDGLVEAGGTIHRVRLTGLRPDTAYSYRIISRAIEGYGPYKVDYAAPVVAEPARFRTLGSSTRPFSFVVLNDLHEDVETMSAHIRRATAAPPELVFLNGDSLSHIESDEQILEKLLAPASRLFAERIPLILVRGNHETRGRNARRLADYLALPDGRYYYSFDHGPVHFIVLDCGEDKEDEHWAYSGLTAFDAYRAVEAEWLRNEVRSESFRRARFRVLIAHMPFYGNEGTNVSGHGPTECRELWGEILNEAGLDLHIAAHTHRVSRVAPTPGANTFPVLVGGSSTRGQSTMMRVDVTPDKLAVTVLRDDGTVALTDTVPVRRPSSAAPPRPPQHGSQAGRRRNGAHRPL